MKGKYAQWAESVIINPPGVDDVPEEVKKEIDKIDAAIRAALQDVDVDDEFAVYAALSAIGPVTIIRGPDDEESDARPLPN